jgi:pentatricopeptide repeat protein
VVLSAFTKQGTIQSLQHAELLLERIESIFVSGDSPETANNYAYNLLLDAYSRVLGLMYKSQRIQVVMKRMEQLANDCDNPLLLPDRISYSSLIRALVKESEPGYIQQVEDAVCMMEESSRPTMKPDLKTYTMVLDAYSRSRDPAALERAASMLERLKARFARGESTLRPDVVIYTILIKIYSNAGDPNKSESFLSMMAQEFLDGNLTCRPDEAAYVTAMNSWETSEEPNSIDRVMRLFNEMTKEYDSGNPNCRPGLKTFRQLMTTLARLTTAGDDQDRSQALQAAINVLEFLRSSKLGADSDAYGALLYACENSIDNMEERDIKLCEVFSKCAADGRVNQKILFMLRRLLPADRYQSLTLLDPKKVIAASAIPRDWRRKTTNKIRGVESF